MSFLDRLASLFGRDDDDEHQSSQTRDQPAEPRTEVTPLSTGEREHGLVGRAIVAVRDYTQTAGEENRSTGSSFAVLSSGGSAAAQTSGWDFVAGPPSATSQPPWLPAATPDSSGSTLFGSAPDRGAGPLGSPASEPTATSSLFGGETQGNALSGGSDLFGSPSSADQRSLF